MIEQRSLIIRWNNSASRSLGLSCSFRHSRLLCAPSLFPIFFHFWSFFALIYKKSFLVPSWSRLGLPSLPFVLPSPHDFQENNLFAVNCTSRTGNLTKIFSADTISEGMPIVASFRTPNGSSAMDWRGNIIASATTQNGAVRHYQNISNYYFYSFPIKHKSPSPLPILSPPRIPSSSDLSFLRWSCMRPTPQLLKRNLPS